MSKDDTGTEFASLDLAYLDAFRAAGEMWHDMSCKGVDGSRCCFEITNNLGQLLIELPFTEVFQTTPRVRPSPSRKLSLRSTRETATKSQSLAAEIAELVAKARKTIAQTQRVLERAGPPTLDCAP